MEVTFFKVRRGPCLAVGRLWPSDDDDDDEDSDGDVDIGGDDDDDGRKAGDLDATHIWEDSQLHQAINKIRIQHFLIMTVLMIVMMMIVMVMMFVKKMMTMEIFLLITLLWHCWLRSLPLHLD